MQNPTLKYLFVLFVVGSGIFSVYGCSRVEFSQGSVNCPVNNPCVGAQGTSQVEQTFTFDSTNKVDILVVDDNSTSMTTEQENLGTPFNGFINGLNQRGLDWQVGVTNTDVCGNSVDSSNLPTGFCGQQPTQIPGANGTFMNPQGYTNIYGKNIITPSTPNAAGVFLQTVQRNSEVGSGDERGIFAANLAIDQANTANAGFFRNDSNLAVVILSDEDERSVGGSCQEIDPADPTQYQLQGINGCDGGQASLSAYDYPATLISKVQSAWGGTKNLNVYSIIIPPKNMTLYPDPNANGAMQTCLQVQSHQGPTYTAHPGTYYQSLSQQTGGMVGSICDNGQGAFANMLSTITGDLQVQLNTNIVTLAYTPSSQPSVTFSPTGNSVPWTWSANTIIFSTRPANGTTVQVTYNFNASAQANFAVPIRAASPLTMKALPLRF